MYKPLYKYRPTDRALCGCGREPGIAIDVNEGAILVPPDLRHGITSHLWTNAQKQE